MELAFICTEKLTVPPISGGAIQQYIHGVLPYISKHHNVTVFCAAHPDLPAEEIVDGVKYVRSPGKPPEDYINNTVLKMEDKFDLVHVFNRPKWVPVIKPLLKKAKLGLSLHNEMFLWDKISIPTAIECIDSVEFITCVSQFIANGVRELYPSADKKLKVVYSGADINKFSPNWSEQGIKNKALLRSRLNITKENVVLYVSRLCPNKGSDIVMMAMKMVMDTREDVALVVVGSKWYGDNKLDEFTKSLNYYSETLKGQVVFTGFIPPAELASYFNIGDIFICASQWDEPLARVHYEAMAAGLPIITTNRGGNTEVVAQRFGNGVAIDEYNNPKVLAGEINYLLENPSFSKELGKTGRKYAEESYNLERVAKDLLKLFDTV